MARFLEHCVVMRTQLTVLTLVISATALACVEPADEQPVEPSTAHYQYVVDSLHFATSPTEAIEIGVDLDGDSAGRHDNGLGMALAIVAGPAEFDLDLETRTLIDNGDILHLFDVETASLDRANNVTVDVLHAVDTDGDSSDNFSGRERFAVDRAPGRGTMTGMIVDGNLHVAAGRVPLAVTFPGLGQRFIVELSAATVRATIDEHGVTGTLAGAIAADEIRDTVLPLLHAGLSNIVARDCPDGVCIADSFGETLVESFDVDGDGAISYAELAGSALLASLLSPDVDLLDENGQPCTRCDGVKDSLSIAVGFTAVPAFISE